MSRPVFTPSTYLRFLMGLVPRHGEASRGVDVVGRIVELARSGSGHDERMAVGLGYRHGGF